MEGISTVQRIVLRMEARKRVPHIKVSNSATFIFSVIALQDQ